MKRSLLLLTVLLLTAGCARFGGGNPPSASPSPSDNGEASPSPSASAPADESAQLVLRLEESGGFVPVEWIRTNLPSVSVYADGTVITVGPQIMIYPGPALPNLQRSTISQAQIDQILAAAEAAGLTNGVQDLPLEPMVIADASTTILTVVADGETHVTSAYALLGLGEQDTDPARESMRDFLNQHLGSLARDGSEEYELSALRVWSSPGNPEGMDPEFANELDWPLQGDLATFGEPSTYGAADETELRCGVVEGEDLDTLLAALGEANQLTTWRSDGALYALQLRPLLPDESGCPVLEF